MRGMENPMTLEEIKKPWPNGSGIVIPRWLAHAALGVILTVGSASAGAIWYVATANATFTAQVLHLQAGMAEVKADVADVSKLAVQTHHAVGVLEGIFEGVKAARIADK